VNGSLGLVEEFITIAEARERHIKIAEITPALPNADVERPPNQGGVITEWTAENELREKTVTAELVPLNDAEFNKHQRWPLVKFTNGLLLLCAPSKLLYTSCQYPRT
jgi:hypothetical protein